MMTSTRRGVAAYGWLWLALAARAGAADAQAAGFDPAAPENAGQVEAGGGVAGTSPSSASGDQPGADGALGEIVVTALKTATNLQNTPLTVATVSGAALSRQAVTDVRDALRGVPGLVFTSTTNSGVQISARGVGPGILRGQGGMSTLYDGIYSSFPIAGRVSYYDVSRYEVLLGPQGTLYGRNAEGGVVNLVTNNPTHDTEGSVTAGVGNYSLYTVQGMANVALTDTLYFRMAGSYNKRNGYLSNGQNDNGTAGFRAKLLFEPSSDFSVLLGGEHYIIDELGQASVSPFVTPTRSVFNVNFATNQYYRQVADRAWAEINADVGIGKLTIIPSYFRAKEPNQLSYQTYGFGPAAGGFQQYSLGQGAATEKSIEARLSSRPSSPIQWIAGVYFYDLRDVSPPDSFERSSDFAVSGSTVYVKPGAIDDTRLNTQFSQGYFAQATVPVLTGVRIIGGIRYSKDKSRAISDGFATPPAFNSVGHWSHTDYRAGVQYDAGRHSLLYGTVSSGYRPGGFSPAPPYGAYGIEQVTSYEIGSKNEFLDGHLRVNGDVYYYDYKGYQQVTFEACSLPTAPNPSLRPCVGSISPEPNIANLGKVSVKGGELAVQFAATRADRLTFNASYNDSKIETDLLVNNPSPFDQVNVRGAHLPYVPVVAGNLTYEHDFDLFGGTLTPQATALYQSKINLALPEQQAAQNQRGVVRFDGTVTFTPANHAWSLNIWGRNLSNQIVKAAYNASSTYLAPPRTYGATVSVTF